MFRINHILLLFLSVWMMSCSHYPPDVGDALSLAGKNRNELEKVLKHYSYHERDSLKLKAAFFLIANMPGKYSRYERYYDADGYEIPLTRFSSATESGMTGIRDSVHKLINRIETVSERDLESVTSGFLIDNIDQAFDAWENPWASHVSFDYFCRFILPYRCMNEPLSSNWRTMCRERYSWLADSMRNQHDPVEAYLHINKNICGWMEYKRILIRYKPSLDSMFVNPYGLCDEITYTTIYILRAMGIAVSMDMIPCWAMKHTGHLWCNVLDTANRFILFDPSTMEAGSGLNERWRFAKVFRKEFRINSESPQFKYPDITKPSVFYQIDLFDVTGEYTTTSNLSLSVREIPGTPPEVAYMAVYNDGLWKPTELAPVKDDTAYFRNMGNRGILYRLMYDNGEGKKQFAPYPFVLHEDNSIQYLVPAFERTLLRQVEYYSTREGVGHNKSFDLYYWGHEKWEYLQTIVSDNGKLTLVDIPDNALFLFRKTGEPFNGRIRPFLFTGTGQAFK